MNIWQNFSAKFTIQNILDRDYKKIYRYLGQEYIYQSYTRGINYALRFEYEI